MSLVPLHETLPSLATESHSDTAGALLWSQAFTAQGVAREGEKCGMHVGDPAKANGRGMTPLHLAVQAAADSLVRTLLAWDEDLQHDPFRPRIMGSTGIQGSGQSCCSSPKLGSSSPKLGSASPRPSRRGASPNTARRCSGERSRSGRRRSREGGAGGGGSPLGKGGSPLGSRPRLEVAPKRVRSLCNVHNLWTGDSPLLLCLRSAGKFLRRKDDERSKSDDLNVLQLLETARKIITHPYTNVFNCGATVNLDGRVIVGGGASPLLFLLAAAERLQVSNLPHAPRNPCAHVSLLCLTPRGRAHFSPAWHRLGRSRCRSA